MQNSLELQCLVDDLVDEVKRGPEHEKKPKHFLTPFKCCKYIAFS